MPNATLDLPATLDLDQFLSEEAHDLRTPFNHITGFSKLILSGTGPLYTAEMLHDDMATVYQSGQRALLLMNSLIDAARLKRHEKEASFSTFQVKTLLEQSIALWKKFNPNSGLQPEYHILTAIPRLIADEILLRQALAGFILYVAQYVDLEAQVTLTVEDEPGWFVLTVTSQGKKVQPFSRLDLQLQGYVNRALIELQRGAIRRAEETDDGALIQFVLPNEQAADNPHRPDSAG